MPDGDVLLHAGDITDKGTFEELQAQLDWLKSLPHMHKIVIDGNHDRLIDAEYVTGFQTASMRGKAHLTAISTGATSFT